jgi:hypothetical protein
MAASICRRRFGFNRPNGFAADIRAPYTHSVPQLSPAGTGLLESFDAYGAGPAMVFAAVVFPLGVTSFIGLPGQEEMLASSHQRLFATRLTHAECLFLADLTHSIAGQSLGVDRPRPFRKLMFQKGRYRGESLTVNGSSKLGHWSDRCSR